MGKTGMKVKETSKRLATGKVCCCYCCCCYQGLVMQQFCEVCVFCAIDSRILSFISPLDKICFEIDRLQSGHIN